MEIRFGNKKFQQLCLNRSIAVKHLGDICARRLGTRLSEIEAAKTVKDLIAGNPHRLYGSRAGEYALTLHGGVRLTFSAANDPCPTTGDGSIDWDAVSIICIEFIGDYHD